MASSGSIKDLTKAINTFMQAPALPLPDELVAIIGSYLERHENADDGANARLNEELLSIYAKTVQGCPGKYAGFLAILRELRPAIRTAASIFEWWDRLLDPVLEHVGQEKGLAREVLNNTLDLLSIDGPDASADDKQAGLTPFTIRLLKRWMDARANEPKDASSVDFKERMVKKALMVFGKKDPKGFMTCLDSYVVKKEYRNWALSLLCDFVQSQPPHLHLILQTPLFVNILHCLQRDDSTSTITVALIALIMILPYIPSSLVPLLPTLFNIYARLLFWDKDSYFAREEIEISGDSDHANAGVPWEKIFLDPDHDGHSIAYLSRYFTILYGLYPINFMDYIRKPQRYLRHANNPDDIDVQAMEIRDRSERFRDVHRLHPNFYNLTIETEKTDLRRWIKSEADEVLGNCMALFIEPETVSAQMPIGTPVEGVFSSHLEEESEEDSSGSNALLGGPFRYSSSVVRDSLSASSVLPQSVLSSDQHLPDPASHTPDRRGSQVSSHPSGPEPPYIKAPSLGGDSPTLPPHLGPPSSHPQIQDLSQPSKMVRPGLHQLRASDSVPSLDLSPQASALEKGSIDAHQASPPNTVGSVTELNEQVSRLYHENLLLRNDLQFERYLTKQHISHMGELRRKQIREAATEAETQNLVMVNRSLKQRLDDAKRSEGQLRKEYDRRRNMAQKWESDLTTKLRSLRDEQKREKVELEGIKQRLETAQEESRRLRKLVDEAEKKRLDLEQRLEAIDLSADDIESLRREIARLTESEREYQGKQLAMTRAMESAEISKNKAEQLSAHLAAMEKKLAQTKSEYSSQIADVNAKLDKALKENSGKSASGVAAAYEIALATSRARQTELQKQYSSLMRKYTILQSSLLDMNCDAADKKVASSKALSPLFDSEPDSPPLARSPIAIQNRLHRGLSDPETFDGVSHNATPPLGPMSNSQRSPMQQRPATPGGGGGGGGAPDVSGGGGRSTSPQTERYHGRGGFQNAAAIGSISKKDRKDKKEDKGDKKDKKQTARLGGIRGFV